MIRLTSVTLKTVSNFCLSLCSLGLSVGNWGSNLNAVIIPLKDENLLTDWFPERCPHQCLAEWGQHHKLKDHQFLWYSKQTPYHVGCRSMDTN